MGGYTIGYDIFEGNIYEGHTLIPFIEKIAAKFNLEKPIIVADSGLLSKDNIIALDEKKYEYIIGARLKSEHEKIKQQILDKKLIDGDILKIKRSVSTLFFITVKGQKRAAL